MPRASTRTASDARDRSTASRRAAPRSGLGPPSTETYATRESRGDHGGDRLDAERNRANERSGFGVEHGERVVRRQRNDGEPFAVRAGARGDGGRAGHEVAERAGIEPPAATESPDRRCASKALTCVTAGAARVRAPVVPAGGRRTTTSTRCVTGSIASA